MQEFSAAVCDGQDLRCYEDVYLSVNRAKGRAGIQCTFQQPNVLGGGANLRAAVRESFAHYHAGTDQPPTLAHFSFSK